LLGPSGAGKSSLLALLLGIEAPDRGRVLWRGVDMTRAAQSSWAVARRGQIGIVGQSFALLEQLPVWQGAAIALVPQGVSRAEQRKRSHAALERVGISAALAQRLPRELSGGERQRVALARALLSAKTALVADEPSSNQDAQSARWIVQALCEEQARGCAVVLATHDPQLESFADQRLQLLAPAGVGS
jgi:ABC-type lipoprotein export system ATPase subunit